MSQRLYCKLCASKIWTSDCCIVFNSYENGPSTKDQEHLRSGKKCADIKLSETMEAHITQQTFLNNEKKQMSVYSFIEPIP